MANLKINLLILLLCVVAIWPSSTVIMKHNQDGLRRPRCEADSQAKIQIRTDSDNIIRRRLADLRNQMRTRESVQGPEIDAYIVTSFDEHLNEETTEHDERLRFISNFGGRSGLVAITSKSAALWTDERFTELADHELDCEWKLFRFGEYPTVAEWLANELSPDSLVGADPRLVPHTMWAEWDKNFTIKYLRLLHIRRNLVDLIWQHDRPEPMMFSIKVQPLNFAGERWESKVQRLKRELSEMNVEAMVVTSLTEITWLFNLRGFDYPFTPVFKAYAIVTMNELYLYVNRHQVTKGIELHLKLNDCTEQCINLRNYHDIWGDIHSFTRSWSKVLLPAPLVFDRGVSEAIYSAFHRGVVVQRPSPIIYMRAAKNEIERDGMRRAHVRDAAAMCDVLAYLEDRFAAGDEFSELKLAYEFDRARRSQNYSKGISLPTTVAYGSHAGQPYYVPSIRSNYTIEDDSVILIESGGQYLDGTTDVSRTVHLGEPSDEQRRAYTNVLQGLIRLSMLVFPENIDPAEIDALVRGPQWIYGSDYPHGTGHGIGAYSSVHESPINIAYNSKNTYNKNKNSLKEGYFFTSEPGYYRPGYYGIRLENVLEVVDTGERHPSGERFLAFRDVTLVPFEPKLIDGTLLSAREKKWLNEYNSRIRQQVGAELKRRVRQHGFYWMMNKTRHVVEYLPESDYLGSGATRNCMSDSRTAIMMISSLIYVTLRLAY